MSDELDWLSRRTLISVAGISPLALFAAVSGRAEAQPLEGCEEAVVNCDKLVKVTTFLWGKFQQGVTNKQSQLRQHEKLPDKRIEAGEPVFLQAWAKSGPYIIKNLGSFPEAPPDYNHQMTSDCCIMCGTKAAEKANVTGQREISITAANFDEAWTETKIETMAKMSKAMRISGNFAVRARVGLGCT